MGVELAVNAQVLPRVEVLPAGGAVEGFVAGVRQEVYVQTGLEAKLLPTLGAGVVLLARVGGQVALEVVGAPEGLAADLALVGLLTRVDLHVVPPAAALREPLAAVLTDEGPVPRVGAHVVSQALRRGHLLAALGAVHSGVKADRAVLGPGVLRFVAHVRTLTPGLLKTLPAVAAAEVPALGDHRHVVPALAVVPEVLEVLEAAGAHGARVQPPRRRRGVGLPAVRSQGHLGGESAATVRTTVLGGGA